MPATSKVSTLRLPDDSVLYIETVSIDGDVARPGQQPSPGVEGESTEIGFGDTFSMLRRAVSGIGAALHVAYLATKPDEMTVELSFALKGETELIPVLINGSGEGSIRVAIKWKKLDVDDG
jgi:hypothetical protein